MDFTLLTQEYAKHVHLVVIATILYIMKERQSSNHVLLGNHALEETL